MRKFKLALAAALTVVALPLGAGTWAFADFAAGSEQRRSDARLRAAIDRGIDRFRSSLERAELEARALASSPSVQRALASSDGGTLRRIARANPAASFSTPAVSVGERRGRPAARRSVEVFVGGRRVGRVVVGVPLDNTLVRRLALRAGLLRDGRIVLARRGRVIAPRAARGALELPRHRFATVRLGGVEYRALAAPLLDRQTRTDLVVLEPNAPIQAAASRLRRRIVAVGLTVLLAIALTAYAVAPALSRGRVLRRQRAQAERVLSQIGEGVFFVDTVGVIRLWNYAAERITGLAAESVLGRPVEQAIPGWPAVGALVTVAPSGAPTEARAATVPFASGGGELWLSISGVAIAEGTIYAFRDLTEDHRLEEAKRDFVTTVSHELRTPLTSVYGAAVTLRERGETLTEATREQLIEVIADGSERLARLVDQILLADELDSGRSGVTPSSFDAVEVARSVVEAARTGRARELSLELVAPPSPPRVAADPERTRQVLWNLVDNAVKYSPEGGRVTVELEPRDGHLRFTVRDEGLGIPAAEHDRIFEKFYRLDAAMTRGVGGSGLGLYICRGLVHQMNGTISVTSRPGAGSAFSVELPVSSEPDAASNTIDARPTVSAVA